MQIISARDPQWADKDHTTITLFVTFDTVGEVPFGASPNDPETHGREIFARAANGEFGTITEYQPERN